MKSIRTKLRLALAILRGHSVCYRMKIVNGTVMLDFTGNTHMEESTLSNDGATITGSIRQRKV